MTQHLSAPTTPAAATRELRVMIADDHGVVRSGIRLLLDQEAGLSVVAEACDGAEAVEVALRERPDVCVLDVAMPKLTGIQATRTIRQHLPATHVLILSMHEDERYLFEALKAGASGYVLKREADRVLVDAVRAVASGESFLTNAAEASLVRSWREEPGRLAPDEPLTAREQEVLKLIAEAHTNKEIAEVLHLSEKTVESHRGNLLRKLGMRDRVELVRYAIRRGLIEP
jgi:DNA-binding NarL/FixJ family response regulator